MNPTVGGMYGTFNQIWHTALQPGQYWTVVGFSALTALSLSTFFIWALTQQKNFDPRYHTAIRAGLTLTAVAALSYFLILYKLFAGYSLLNGLYSPSTNGLLDVPARYIDWAINVPLLVMALIGVSALNVAKAQWLRLAGVVSAFLMILCGYLGEVATPSGLGERVGWGIASSVFFVIVDAIVIYTVVKSSPALTARENAIYRLALGVLLGVWFVYPIMYGLNGVVSGPGWAAAAQITYSIADLIAKVGFGLLVFKVARLRSERSRAAAR